MALGFLQGKLGNAERALDAYREAVEVDAETVQAYQGMGWIHLQRRELQDAMNMIAKSTELAPEYAPNYVLMGRVLTSQGFSKMPGRPLRPHSGSTPDYVNNMAFCSRSLS